jgi:predicted metal-dependent hydrolase
MQPAYELQIKRAFCRSWVLRVEAPARVTIKVPFFLTKSQIAELLEKKKNWIQKRLQLFAEQAKGQVPRRYVSGEEFRYQGRALHLVVSPGRAKQACLDQDLLMVEVPGAKEGAERDALSKRGSTRGSRRRQDGN